MSVDHHVVRPDLLLLLLLDGLRLDQRLLLVGPVRVLLCLRPISLLVREVTRADDVRRRVDQEVPDLELHESIQCQRLGALHVDEGEPEKLLAVLLVRDEGGPDVLVTVEQLVGHICLRFLHVVVARDPPEERERGPLRVMREETYLPGPQEEGTLPDPLSQRDKLVS